MNLKYTLNFIRMEEIDLNWIFYEDIEEVIDEKIDNENVTVDNDHEI